MKYWVDTVGGRVGEIEFETKPFGFRTAPITQLKPLIASEDVTLEKGKPAVIDVETLAIPNNTMVGPLHGFGHAAGSVTDVLECGIPLRVEDEKCVNQVVFLPVEDGDVKKGDLLGVLKVFFIKTSTLSKLFSVGEPKVSLIIEDREVNLVWKEDGKVFRERTRTKDITYNRTHIAIWEPIIADEDIDFESGEILRVKIRDVKIPSNTVIVPIGYRMNPYGSVIDVRYSGKPRKIEEMKVVQHAMFLSIEDGSIKKGDLLGAMALYFIDLTDPKDLGIGYSETVATLVVRENGRVERRPLKILPFGYRRSPVARWELLIANENKVVKAGKPCEITIKKVTLPRDTIMYTLSIMRNVYGVTVDTIPNKLHKVEDEREIVKVVFLPVVHGEIRKGELLGVISIHDVEVNRVEKIRSWMSRTY